jgi:hypothetical protein
MNTKWHRYPTRIISLHTLIEFTQKFPAVLHHAECIVCEEHESFFNLSIFINTENAFGFASSVESLMMDNNAFRKVSCRVSTRCIRSLRCRCNYVKQQTPFAEYTKIKLTNPPRSRLNVGEMQQEHDSR